MDMRVRASLNPDNAAIPELGVFDETDFESNPIWAIAAVQRQPPPAVLVVDDDPAIAALLHRLLRGLLSDYEVIAETNPTAALQHLCGRAVPLVITDFSMPKMSGLELTTQIKAQSPQTRVLLVSAFANTGLERQ